MAALATVGHGLVSSGIIWGANLRGEMLDGHVTELLHGRYPYYFDFGPTEVAGFLPGATILATPFVVLLGTSAYQNIFWGAASFYLFGRYMGSMRSSLMLAAPILLGLPSIVREFIAGSEYLTNSLVVTLVVLGIGSYSRLGPRQRTALAVFSGLALSWRVNFLTVIPPMVSFLIQNIGLRPALRYISVPSVIFVAVTVPFWAYDPDSFSPIHVARRITEFSGLSIPNYVAMLIPGAAGVASVALSFQRMKGSPNTLLRNCAIVLAIPTLLGIPLTTFHVGAFEVSHYANFGHSFLFLGALVAWNKRPKRVWSADAVST
ncbi:hypothetical protein ACFLX9_00435 [Chloroflexota bacterium]